MVLGELGTALAGALKKLGEHTVVDEEAWPYTIPSFHLSTFRLNFFSALCGLRGVVSVRKTPQDGLI